MNAKKIALVIVTVLILGLGSLIAFFYWTQLRGVAPAITPAPVNIGEVIDKTPPQEQSTTGFPLKLPTGYKVSTYADNIPGARVMIYDNAGRILVSSPETGKIFAVKAPTSETQKAQVTTVIDKLNNPHGMATYCYPDTDDCRLYVAEEDKLSEYQMNLDDSFTFIKKLVDFPSGGNHFTRTLMFMPYPDHTKLLISIGSSCNVCNEESPLRATIQSYDIISGKLTEFAKGLRNSVFMSIHPVNGKIWATEMGRDLLGDNTPPDEINIIEQGKNYGWPTCYGKNIHDNAFDKNTYIRNPCMEPFETPSHIDIQAHSAPLGLAFIPEEGWPEEMWYNALVAYHGSWNRTEPTGYKIVRYKLDQNGKFLGSEDFITGWLKDGKALGRPVDIIVHPGGTIFISDDKAGLIYKVNYAPPAKTAEELNNLIHVTSIKAGDLITSPVRLAGEARGNWYFEASFPVSLQDANGKILAQIPIQAIGEWMTTEFVPFDTLLTFPQSTTDTGTLTFHKDNPSALAENDASISFPVRFR